MRGWWCTPSESQKFDAAVDAAMACEAIKQVGGGSMKSSVEILSPLISPDELEVQHG